METLFSQIVLLISFLGFVTAHVGLTYPPARKLELDFLDNIRTKMPCGMPKGELRTQLQPGPVNISWHLAYPHLGGYRIELLDKDEKLMLKLSDPTSTTSHVTGDPTAQWHTINIPESLTCEDCTIRLLREAKEWANKYAFWSCADVSIVKAKDYKEDCFGRGTPNSDSGCSCDKGYWGPSCQYKDECVDDSDCNNGKCIDIGGTSLPRKQCFCSAGFHGEGCKLQNKDTLPTPENLQLSSHTKTMLSDRMELYHKMVSDDSVPDDEKEMEFVLVINGTSYAAIGMRPSTIDKTCKSLPAVDSASNVAASRTKRAAKSKPQKSNPTLLEPLQLPEKIQAEPEPSMNNKRSTKDKKGFGNDKLAMSEKHKSATAEPSTPESESAPEIVPSPETVPEPIPEAEPEPENGKAEPSPIKEPAAEPEKPHSEPTPEGEGVAEPKPEIAAEPQPESSKAEPIAIKEPAAEPEKPSSEPAAEPEKPSSEPAAEPEKPSSEPVAEPEKPSSEPAAEPEKPSSEPVAEPEKPSSEPAAEPEKPSSEPVAEPEKPSSEPVAEPEKPHSEPHSEPENIAEPTPEGESVAEPESENSKAEPNPTNKPTAKPEKTPSKRAPAPETEPTPEGEISAESQKKNTIAEPEPNPTYEPTAEPEKSVAEPAAEAEPHPESEPEPKGKSLLETSPFKLERTSTPYTPKGDLHAMDCTDIVIGTARGMLSRVRDYYTRDRSTPRLDTFWGGTEDLTSATGWEMNGITTIIFRRKMKSMDPTDHSISGTMHLIWARGQEHGEYVHLPRSGLEREKPSVPNFYAQDEIKYHGQSKQRGVRFIDFSERL